MNGKRKLSAILFADIVGYTKLMQQSEVSGLDALDKFKSIVNETVPRYSGEVVKSYGDGCLMLFDVPSSAIQCAIAMQKAFRKGKSIPVRIGAHIGEVIQTEDDYYGDGINIASRLESLAEPNSILISRAMKDQIRNKEFADTAYIGTVNLKNVEDIQEIYALSNKGLSVPKSTSFDSGDAGFSNPIDISDVEFEKNKKAFSTLAGLGIAAIIMFVGFGIIGVTSGKAVSILVLLIICFLVMMYFIMFGLRFDVFGGPSAQVTSSNSTDNNEYDNEDPLDLKELDAQPRKYNKKDFI